MILCRHRYQGLSGHRFDTLSVRCARCLYAKPGAAALFLLTLKKIVPSLVQLSDCRIETLQR
jgi:hypothetical protein